MIIDFHTHIFTDNVARNALPILAERAGINPFTDATAKGLVESMRIAGIDYSVVANIATRVEQVKKINIWACELSATYPDIISLGSLHPEMLFDDIRQEIAYLKKNNIKGIKLHPDYQNFYVDDMKIFDMYNAINDAGMFILFHSGVDIGLPGEIHCTPQRLLTLIEKNNDLTIIAAHMGGYHMWDEVNKYLIGTDIYLDTSFAISEIGIEQSVSMILKHGVNKIIFGSDSPWKSQKDELALIQSLPLNEDDILSITGRNAAELLSLI